MNTSEILKRDLQSSIEAVSAAFTAIQYQAVIDSLDSLFKSFSEWGIPADAVLDGCSAALENNYGLRVVENEGDEEA